MTQSYSESERPLADRIAAYRDQYSGDWSSATLSLAWGDVDRVIDALRATPPAAAARCSAGIDEAQAIVTEWIGMFDPPPQIDFQQSEMLQQAIAHALRHDAQPAMERVPVDKLAFCFGVSIEKALKAQGDIGFMYRELASPLPSTDLGGGK